MAECLRDAPSRSFTAVTKLREAFVTIFSTAYPRSYQQEIHSLSNDMRRQATVMEGTGAYRALAVLPGCRHASSKPEPTRPSGPVLAPRLPSGPQRSVKAGLAATTLLTIKAVFGGQTERSGSRSKNFYGRTCRDRRCQQRAIDIQRELSFC